MGGKKAGGGFLGIGGKSGFLNTGLLSSGPQKIKGFSMDPAAVQAERNLIARQEAIASGNAPSITELQYKQALEDSLKAQQSAVASTQGVSNTGLLQRQAMLQGQQAGLDVARESAAAKLSEQRSADQLIAATAAAQRGVAFQQQAMNTQNTLANQKMQGEFIGSLASGAAKMGSGGAGGGAAGGGAAASSDENMKTNIKENSSDANKTISEFMDALKSYTYEYKKGAKQPGGKPNPEGEVKSVMAQDLEKSDLGKQMVTDTPNGKVVDYAQGMAPLFAAIAELNKRTKKLEGK